MSQYALDVSDKIALNKDQKNIIKTVLAGLNKAKAIYPKIDSIGINGGFMLDIILNLEPFDIDIKYSIKSEKSETVRACVCKELQDLTKELNVWNNKPLDFGNYLKYPHLPVNLPIYECEIGLFSHQTEYVSMFFLNSDGRIWSNSDALKDLGNKTYEIRLEGLLIWTGVMKKDYFATLTGTLFRGLGYAHKRAFNFGPKFKQYIEELPYIVKNINNLTSHKEHFKNYFYTRVGTLENLVNVLEKNNITNKTSIINTIQSEILNS